MLRARLYLPDPEKDEKIELILRRHSFSMVGIVLVYIILLAVPWVLRWFCLQQFPDLWQDNYWHAVFYLLGSIYTLFIILFFFTAFIDYWLDVWVVTTERIVSMEQKGLFARKLVEQKLHALQDVTSKVDGFFPTLFHYGEVAVQSAGAVPNTVLKQIPRADVVARKIVSLMEDSKHRHQMQE
jgi:hypothetical protein